MVEARDYRSFWLWPGVHAGPELGSAASLYILDGEIRAADPGRYIQLRAAEPRLAEPSVWLVVRTDTLDWPGGMSEALVDRLDRWGRASDKVVGLQIDFDARTRHLDRYAAFLRALRATLPRRYRLSVTGLMDWSANGDPDALRQLAGTVDEIVIQTYQGRATIRGYDDYLRRLDRFPVPFKIGLVEHGRWREPANLKRNPRFGGYVVFLTEG